ncbi:MAG: cytochrome c [Acidobacteriota bacterium]|nr:cytochrome c [Acidobacteriota bacterium]
MLRLGWFVFGVVTTCVVLALGAYFYVKEGGVRMAVDSPEQPFEAAVAKMALHASFANSLGLSSPAAVTDENLAAGGQVYKSHCAGCHGSPGKPSGMAKRMFPPPPQLLEPNAMVPHAPVGETYWKVTNGIRLSGMPEFKSRLSDTERWQVTLLLKHADKLPPAAEATLSAH